MADTNPFEGLLGDYKTYITAGLGIAWNVLISFHVWTPTAEQVTATNSAIILLAAIFLRAGIKKAQASAAKAAVASESAAEQVGAQAMAQKSRF